MPKCHTLSQRINSAMRHSIVHLAAARNNLVALAMLLYIYIYIYIHIIIIVIIQHYNTL